MHLAEEWQHVVLAEREHLNVLHNHHLVVIDIEHGAAQYFCGIFVVSLGEKGHGFLDASGSLHQAVTIGILAEALQYFAIHLLRADAASPASLSTALRIDVRTAISRAIAFVLSPRGIGRRSFLATSSTEH